MPTINQHHGRYNIVRRSSKPIYIVCHYTGSGTSKAGSALANCKYFSGGNRNASAHYFIDDGGIWEYADPWSYTTWHCGDGHGRYGITNTNSVGIEVCQNGNVPYTQTEMGYLQWLVKKLMSDFGIPASRVVRHYDASRKACPYYYTPSGAGGNAAWDSLHAYITGGGAAPSGSQPSGGGSASSGTLDVDGIIGVASTRRWQQVMGTIMDGIISGQYRGSKRRHSAIRTIRYGRGGSNLIRAVQRVCGITQDGLLGPDTIRHIQARLGVAQDGYFGPITARALQRRLNKGGYLQTIEGNTSNGKPASTPASGLTVDGWWGSATTRRLQQVLGTPQDGVVSSQWTGRRGILAACTSGWEWTGSPKGSIVIRAMQGRLGVSADGIMGPATVRALEAHYGTVQDGHLDGPSRTVKLMQEALNSGRF